jgi:hypothetical protein
MCSIRTYTPITFLGRGMAQAAGAKLLLPAQDRVRFPFTVIEDGHNMTFWECPAPHHIGSRSHDGEYVLLPER